MSTKKPAGRKAPAAIANLLSVLDLETLEQNLFRGRHPKDGWQRVYGGQVLGQALVAAVRTVPPERVAHSLHAYFLLAGDPSVPIIYEVERLRDGGSFTTRRVKAIQHGKAMFAMSVSFHKDEPGLEHQIDYAEISDAGGSAERKAIRGALHGASPGRHPRLLATRTSH